jgi:hypothetical protein
MKSGAVRILNVAATLGAVIGARASAILEGARAAAAAADKVEPAGGYSGGKWHGHVPAQRYPRRKIRRSTTYWPPEKRNGPRERARRCRQMGVRP